MVVVVKWSASSPSSPTIQVRIPLTPAAFSVKFVLEMNEKQKRWRVWPIFKKTNVRQRSRRYKERKTDRKIKNGIYKQKKRVAVVVSQLVVWSLAIPEVRGSNPIIGKIYIDYCQLYWIDQNKEKRGREWPNFKIKEKKEKELRYGGLVASLPACRKCIFTIGKGKKKMANNGVPILVGMATYLSTGKSKLSFVSKPTKIKLLCCNRQWLIRKKDKSFVQPKFKHFWAVFVAQLAQLARRFLPIPERYVDQIHSPI